MSSPSSIHWPHHLTPSRLISIIRRQKSAHAALNIFLSKSQYKHTTAVLSALITAHPKLINKLIKNIISASNDEIAAKTIDAYKNYTSSSSDDESSEKNLMKNNSDEAFDLFKLITRSSTAPNFSLSFVSVLRRLLDKSLGSRNLPEAIRLLEDFAGRSEVRISTAILNIFIDALCCCSKIDNALQLFVEFPRLCCVPDKDTYRILMAGLCDSGRLDEGIHLLYSMLQRISEKGCEADVVVYRRLLDALCVEGRVKETEEVLGKVLLKGLRIPRRRRAFRGPLLEGQSLEDMRRTIDEALVVRGVSSSASYRAMLMDLYEEGKFEDAQKMFDEMVEKGFRVEALVFEAKIGALCREGRVEEGGEVLAWEMVERGCVPTVQAYNLVMEGFCKEGKVVQAVEFFNKMNKQLGNVASKESFEILVSGLCSEGRFLEAARMMEGMLRMRHRPYRVTFSRLIQGLCSIGRKYEALLWLEEMISHGQVPGVNLWSSLTSVVCFNNHSVEYSDFQILIQGCDDD